MRVGVIIIGMGCSCVRQGFRLGKDKIACCIKQILWLTPRKRLSKPRLRVCLARVSAICFAVSKRCLCPGNA